MRKCRNSEGVRLNVYSFWAKPEAKKYIIELIDKTDSASDLFFIVCCLHEHFCDNLRRIEEKLEERQEKMKKFESSQLKKIDCVPQKEDESKVTHGKVRTRLRKQS